MSTSSNSREGVGGSRFGTIAFLVAVCCAACTGFAESTAKPTVDELAAARFVRVAGPAAGNSVLDLGPKGTWYDQVVGLPTVDFDGKNYRMWFVGAQATVDETVPYRAVEQVGLAISADGLHWDLANEGRPVFGPGPEGSFDDRSICHPFVLRVGDEYWMWYGGIDGRLGWSVGIESGVRIEQVGLAKSKDGIHWQRMSEPVMSIGGRDAVDSIQATGMHVLKIGGQFWMWYGAYDGKHRMALATSDDGVRWTKQNGGKALEGLGGKEQLGPSVYHDGQRFFMLYNHDWNGGWATFAATSDDGIRWNPAHDDRPVLDDAPRGNFDTAGHGRNYAVHPSQMLFHDGQVCFWYSGEDGLPPNLCRIGLAMAPLH